MIEWIYLAAVTVLDKIIWYTDVSPKVHKLFLSPQLGDFRVALGRIKAVQVYRFAKRRVPGYRDYLSHFSYQGPKVGLTTVSLRDVPEMDKPRYIKKYPLLDKVIDGRLPRSGVMFDESSGSSGTPTSWVRGPKERRMTRRIMQVAFGQFVGDREPIVLNTFSMGAWATGFNTSTCLLEIGRVKSIGPDKVKVIDTLLEFGSQFEYVILGYPPFLRALTESKDIDWKKYRISAFFGGEGLSESMRAYLLKYFKNVYGSYGASDLEINIAWESDFTIALRQTLAKDDGLRSELLRQNRGIMPMIFQYNPYDYLFETNDSGELLVTIAREYNLSPRIRYNIHDLGHQIDFYKLKKILLRRGYRDLLKIADLDFGLLFHYGRSDLSVKYNGAVVGPEEIKQIITGLPEYDGLVETFRLISYEARHATKHLLMAIELCDGKAMTKSESDRLLSQIVERLQKTNLDFKSAYSSSPEKPEIRVYKFNTGIFDPAHTKLKNDYVWNIDYDRAEAEGIV
jgi:phenylacetate-coenzyme A ligase PaaK-like adenylate-forming protein